MNKEKILQSLKIIDDADKKSVEIEKKYFKDFSTALYITSWLIKRIKFNKPVNGVGKEIDIFKELKKCIGCFECIEKEITKNDS